MMLEWKKSKWSKLLLPLSASCSTVRQRKSNVKDSTFIVYTVGPDTDYGCVMPRSRIPIGKKPTPTP